jgi:hypothetical protein
MNVLRRLLLTHLDIAQDGQCIIDSLPVEVVHFHLVPSCQGDWLAYGASFGKVTTKKQTIYGYKLHMLMTLNGLILDFELAPAHLSDLAVGAELLAEHTDLLVIGDKGYISAQQAADLFEHNRIHLHTLPRRNQKSQMPAHLKHLFNATRQIIETVNGQLTEQFNIETNHAHSFWGSVHVFIPSSRHIRFASISIVFWASLTSCRSRPWLSLSSIRPYSTVGKHRIMPQKTRLCHPQRECYNRSRSA